MFDKFDPFDRDEWRLSKREWETLMSSISDLTSDMAAHTAALAVLATAVNDIEALVAQLRASSGLNPTDQAALDAAVATLTSATSDVTTEAAGVEADVTPPAAPPAAAPVASPSA